MEWVLGILGCKIESRGGGGVYTPNASALISYLHGSIFLNESWMECESSISVKTLKLV